MFFFKPDWNSSSSTLTVQTSGSTGIPKVLTVRKQQMAQSALFTCAHLNIKPKSTTLLCLPLEYIAGKMVVVRALVAGLNLLVSKPSGNPLKDIEEPIHFAAMTPMQVFNSLQVPLETERLRNIDTLLIGGGAISYELVEALKPFPNAVYSTYGMTETLSHIALRRLSGEEASLYYTPFPSVKLSLSTEGTLVIDAPLIADELLYTNDIAEFLPDGRFRILGRRDNVINSGGVKLQIEVMEEELRRLLTGNFAVTSLPDAKFGERVVLLVEENITLNELKDFSAVTYIKEIITVTEIPQTPNGKTDRAACKRVALVMKQDNNK
ncbi:AMP-binding protein [Bacteroides sp. 214]|uniref:AMP-binding protein n=1 Tax=Bacteroides sp. 214 TaxID=2302935 RepID=UPI001EF31C9B|nr:AMP-binding protein [Bacteroides sp. 214]